MFRGWRPFVTRQFLPPWQGPSVAVNETSHDLHISTFISTTDECRRTPCEYSVEQVTVEPTGAVFIVHQNSRAIHDSSRFSEGWLGDASVYWGLLWQLCFNNIGPRVLYEMTTLSATAGRWADWDDSFGPILSPISYNNIWWSLSSVASTVSSWSLVTPAVTGNATETLSRPGSHIGPEWCHHRWVGACPLTH